MRTLRERICLLLALALFTGCLSACSNGTDSAAAEGDSAPGAEAAQEGDAGDWTAEPVTLSMVHEHTQEAAVTVSSSRMFLRVQEEFLEAYPNVILDVTALGSGEIFERISVLAAADELPDLVYLNGTIFDSISGDGMLADLTPYLNPEDFRDRLSTFSRGGSIYAVPTKYTTYNYVYYNPQLLGRAGYDSFPETWEEMLQAGEAIRELGITPITFGNKLTWCALNCYLNALVFEVCGTDWADAIIAGDGNAAFTDEGFVRSLETLSGLAPLWNADYISADDQWAVAELAKGNAAAHISGSWVAGSIMSYEEEYPGISETIRVARVPTISGESPTIDYAVPQGVGVSSALVGSGAKFEAAVAFVQFLGSDRYSRYMAEVGELGPVEVKVEEDLLLPMQVDMFQVMNGYDNVPNIGSYVPAAISSEMEASVSSYLAGSITAEECAAAIQAVSGR